MTVLLLKVTLLLLIPLAALPLMRRASSAMRHLICAIALGGALLIPLTLLVHPAMPAFRIQVNAAAISSVATRGASIPWFALWAIGVAVLLARIANGYRRVAGLIREAERRQGFAAADVSTPMVAGLFAPIILIPHTWPEDRLAVALRHERAHIERGDLWTNLIAHLACAAYWFHPLVWAVARRMHREQESACDDMVIRSGFEPIVYAEALVAAARHFTSTSHSFSSPMGCHMLTQKTLKSRIARLLDGSLPRMSTNAALRRASILLLAGAGCIALLNAADDKVYPVGGGVAAPHVTVKADPEYTDDAKAAKIEGAVLLTVVVGTDGIAHDINVVRSLDAGLDVKAVEAVQKWHFKPGMKDGQPVAVKATIEINFRLL